MRIRGLGVIDDAVLELSPGFTVVTGETGAGKTMVVTGLGLLFGGRAEAALVRPGAARAAVEGRVVLAAGHPAVARAVDAGGELDDGELLVARTVSAEGRSRAHVGGQGVPVSVLAELAEELIAVHGQSDQQRLLRPARQRACLDRYAGDEVAKLTARYTAAYRRQRAVAEQLATLREQAQQRAQEADLLRFGLAEVRAAEPAPGEDAALAAEADLLAHAEQLRAAATTAHTALLGDEEAADGTDALALISAARRAVEQVGAHDPALAAIGERLAEASYLLADTGAELASYAAGVEADPLRLAAVQDRQAVLSGLTRKYGADVDEVLAWAERAAARVGELDGDDERIASLAAQNDTLRAELGELAGALSAARAAAAERFAAAVSAELASLAMPQAVVSVALRQNEDPDGLAVGSRTLAFGPHGVDEVELLLAPHPGAPPRPLAKGASGGELSRVMLAVEVVFAGADPVPTFVFDEVDAGVGGQAAVEVGRRLARLARAAQVIVVTHLPQVAAFADQHLVVVKSDDGSVTSSGVSALDRSGRVRELSRMLAGLADSQLGRAHAEELLGLADAAKASADGTSGVPRQGRAAKGAPPAAAT